MLDVSRTGALGAIETDFRSGGFFQVGNDNVHPGADVQAFTLDPYAVLDSSWGTPGERWVWLMWMTLTGTAGLVTASVNATVGPIGNALALRQFLLGYWSSFVTIAAGPAGTHALAGVNLRNGAVPDASEFCRLPFPLFPGSGLLFQSSSSGATTIRLQTICWVGPIGVHPPGMM